MKTLTEKELHRWVEDKFGEWVKVSQDDRDFDNGLTHVELFVKWQALNRVFNKGEK